MYKPKIPNDYIEIPVVLPPQLVTSGHYPDFIRMLTAIIKSSQCMICIDGNPVTKVVMLYIDTDSTYPFKIFAKEYKLREYLKYAYHWYATPIGILDTASGSYLRFAGFNLAIKKKEES